VVRWSRVQAVSLRESPFDRRSGMATLRVDSAGASVLGEGFEIPYLAREIAASLYGDLVRRAAATAFRW
jgi:putative membrane protein